MKYNRVSPRNRVVCEKSVYNELKDPYLVLAAAIVNQAVADATAGAKTGCYPKPSNKYELLNFFRSRWFSVLTLGAVDGQELIRRYKLHD